MSTNTLNADNMLRFDTMIELIKNDMADGLHYVSNKIVREVFGHNYKALLDHGISNKLIDVVEIDGRTNIYRLHQEDPTVKFNNYKIVKDSPHCVEDIADDCGWRLELLSRSREKNKMEISTFKAVNSDGDIIYLTEAPSGSIIGHKDIVGYKEESFKEKAIAFLKKVV